MRYERPEALRARLKLGREEYCQRLITTLIVDGPYPRWNSRSTPSADGVSFLRGLWAMSFDEPWPTGDPIFVDEFELPPRHDEERGGAPDWAVIWPDLVWLIELKTERSSHRREQIPLYFELCHHHHPASRAWITYLTPPADYPFAVTEEWARYAHLDWTAIPDLARRAWDSADDPDQQAVLAGVLEAIDSLHLSPAAWRAALAMVTQDQTSPLTSAIALAEQTAVDGTQRALDWAAPTLEALQQLRLDVRSALANSPSESALRHVMPWLWQWASTGRPLTEAGESLGWELRLSRYLKPLY